MFNERTIQALFTLSYKQAKYQLPDRLPFVRFPSLDREDAMPDTTTLWSYREALRRACAVDELLAAFDNDLREHDLLVAGG
jgi:IS5 family transposase